MSRFLAILVSLLVFSATTSAQEPAPEPHIHFNHFFVVVDQDTFDDIQNSEYINSTFAITEIRTTARTDATYSGFYVYGENTYFEILTRSLSPWQSGIFFSPDIEDGLELAKETQLPSLQISSVPITREFENKQVPWFFTARNFGYPSSSQFGVGIMEYHTQYLKEYFPDKTPQSRGVSRKDVLARYASILDISQSDRLLSDVVGVSVSVSPSEHAAMLKLFDSLRYGIINNEEHDVFTDNAFKLRAISDPNSTSRIFEVDMLLNSDQSEDRTLRFGSNSILHVRRDGHAIWSFD